MCLAVPAKVLSIKGKHAKVDFGSREKEIIVGTIEPKIGDYVLVNSGIAIQKISKEEAKSILKIWKKIK